LGAQAARLVGRADQCHRGRLKKRFKVADAHGNGGVLGYGLTRPMGRMPRAEKHCLRGPGSTF
jgi:hypothetical protein